MATTYHKDIILVEVAYCWRPTEYRDKSAPFPESPEGQAQFLDEVNRIVLSTANQRGVGNPLWPAVACAIAVSLTTMAMRCRSSMFSTSGRESKSEARNPKPESEPVG
jgi:arabinogalactan endo-1,4-beta-galactosidase